MLSRIKVPFKNHSGKTTAQNDIGDGIPEPPNRSWIHEVKKKLTRSLNAHVSEYTNGTIRTAAPVLRPQRLEVREPVTIRIDNTTASRPPITAPDALQATFQPLLRPETVSPNAEKIDAPDAEDTHTASLQKKTQTPVLASQVASDPQSSTAVNNNAPVVAQTSGTAMYDATDFTSPLSNSIAVNDITRTSSTAVNDIAPIIAQTSAVEQETKILGHSPKEKQNVLNKSASREYEQEQQQPESKDFGHGPKEKQTVLNKLASREYEQVQKEQFAKRNVHQALEHHLRGYERVRIAICVDMEDHKGSRRVCVTCYDGAVDKAHDIETILSKNGKSLHGFSYVVRRREATKIFGYKGSDIDRIGSAAAITSEGSSDDLAKYPGTLGANTGKDEHMGDDYPVGDTTNHERGGTHTHNGDHYHTFHMNYIPDGGKQAFSNTPYWTKESTMVEIFCGDERNGNITGAPIRMATTRRDGSSAVALWTCGGIIRVGGIDYGLTTAHPLVLSDSVPPPSSPQEKPPSEDAAMSKDLLDDNGPFGGNDDFFSAEEHPEKYWQAIGKVSHYALAKMGSIPSNNDWLLFELPKDRSMWNDFGNSSKQDDFEDNLKRNNFEDNSKRTNFEGNLKRNDYEDNLKRNDLESNSKRNDFGYHAKSSLHDLAVFTARGALAALMLEGTAFLILGNSPFEVLKVGLQEPLRPGDSGSWLMRGSELVGVTIAGSEEDPYRPIGYAISAQEIYRSISTSMGGVSVRPLTALENAIDATSQISGRQLDLAVLRIRQLFDMDASVKRISPLPDHRKLAVLANIQTGNAALTALLKLGFFCSSIGLDFAISRRHRFTFNPFRSRVQRVGEMLYQEMSQLDEGQAVTHLVIALSATLTRTRASHASECARLLSVLMDELNISPHPAHSHLSALVESICGRYKLLKSAYPGPSLLGSTARFSLARSLGRAMYAIRTDAFFVHRGLLGRNLGRFIAAYCYYRVTTVGDDFKARHMTESLLYLNLVPRIYIAEPDELLSRHGKRSWYDVLYGNVVESDELNNLLKDEKATERWRHNWAHEPGGRYHARWKPARWLGLS